MFLVELSFLDWNGGVEATVASYKYKTESGEVNEILKMTSVIKSGQENKLPRLIKLMLNVTVIFSCSDSGHASWSN